MSSTPLKPNYNGSPTTLPLISPAVIYHSSCWTPYKAVLIVTVGWECLHLHTGSVVVYFWQMACLNMCIFPALCEWVANAENRFRIVLFYSFSVVFQLQMYYYLIGSIGYSFQEYFLLCWLKVSSHPFNNHYLIFLYYYILFKFFF